MNRAACRVLRTQMDALNDMIALLRNAKLITVFPRAATVRWRQFYRSKNP